MKELVDSVKVLINEEYGRASNIYGPVHVGGDAHSYSILKEEVEEAQQEMKYVSEQLDVFWKCIKVNERDDIKKARLATLHNRAMCLAAEAIQVAAMAYKAQLTLDALPNDKDSR